MFRPAAFHASRPGLVAPVRLDASGVAGPTRGEVEGPRWRRSSWGVHVPADVAVATDQRIVEAAARLPGHGAVTGWAALHWRGAPWFDRDAAVTLATGGITISRGQGALVSEEGLDPAEIERVDDLPVTSAVRSTCFEMRYARSDRQAAEILSMAAYSDLVAIEEMALYAAAHAGWTGIPRCRWGVDHAVENAWSPPEVAMPLIWQLDAGRPRPLNNVPIFDRAGRFIGTPDLIDPEAGVFGEYDSGLHLAGAQRAKDVGRESAFRRLGLEPAVMVTTDLAAPGRFIQRLDDAYRRARYEPESSRAWTIDPPEWWTPTVTVAQRRALTAGQRERWLRHRRAA